MPEMIRCSTFGDCLTVDMKIAGVHTRCLLYTGLEFTTIAESHFKQHFGEQEIQLSSANWVQLNAANGLDIPVLGCLQEDIECMGKVLSGKCVFATSEASSACGAHNFCDSPKRPFSQPQACQSRKVMSWCEC